MIRDPQTSRPPIVAGDVTGKGLKETMLVALVVGAIRMAAEINSEQLFLARKTTSASPAR